MAVLALAALLVGALLLPLGARQNAVQIAPEDAQPVGPLPAATAAMPAAAAAAADPRAEAVGQAPELELQALLAGNVWLIPTSSPVPMSRPRGQAAFIADTLSRLGPAGPDQLRVVCLQEVWPWHAGPVKLLVWLLSLLVPWQASGWLARAPGFVRTPCEFLLGLGFVVLLYLPGILVNILTLGRLRSLTSWISIWSPGTLFRSPLARAGLPHAIGLDQHDWGPFPCQHGRGLLMFATHEPTASGFVPFSQPNFESEERLATKGVQWAVFGGGGGKQTAVLNLHNRCGSACEGDGGDGSSAREADRVAAELCDIVRSIIVAASAECRPEQGPHSTLEVHLAGDFNMTQRDPRMAQLIAATGLRIVGPGHGSGGRQLAAASKEREEAAVSMYNEQQLGLIDLLGVGVFAGGEPLAAETAELAATFKVRLQPEARPSWARNSPPGTNAQWMYLYLRDLLSDHKLLVCTRTAA
eukprot:SAG22_NODE_1665_length_3861_cov_4.460128_1_plen_470_part_00